MMGLEGIANARAKRLLSGGFPGALATALNATGL